MKSTSAPAETKKIPLIGKIYGLYCLVSGALVLLFGAFLTFVVASSGTDLFEGSPDVTLTLLLSVAQVVLLFAEAAMLVDFGVLMLMNRRRHVAQLAYGLIALNVAATVVEIMLHGIGENLLSGLAQLIILVVIASTIDPTLIAERRLQRKLRDLETEEAAEAGTLGRAKGGRGFIELDFFNLFWVFVVCCFLGLAIETIYHMVFVEPGVYQDRAGMLFGPFSPIYGFGAVLMTIALNRFWRANPVVIFLVAAVIGGLFEAAVSWFMQVAFGAVAWDYSGATLFGLFPDPVAALLDGRTSVRYMCMWGALGLVWIKFCLPWLLRLINLIPWQARYSVTAVCAALMLVNGVMTLQALECWYERESGIAPSSPIEEFYAEKFDDDYMANRFQSMTITPGSSARVPRTSS